MHCATALGGQPHGQYRLENLTRSRDSTLLSHALSCHAGCAATPAVHCATLLEGHLHGQQPLDSLSLFFLSLDLGS